MFYANVEFPHVVGTVRKFLCATVLLATRVPEALRFASRMFDLVTLNPFSELRCLMVPILAFLFLSVQEDRGIMCKMALSHC